MKKLEQIIVEGEVLRKAIYPTLSDDGTSFVYHLDDMDRFVLWANEVQKLARNERLKDLEQSFIKTKKPELLDAMLVKLNSLAKINGHLQVSPFAPRSTDF